MKRAAGFTLIELLVVVALIGLATTAVLLTLPDGDAALYRQADTFGVNLKRAQEEAILAGRTVQVGVDAAGYRFSRQHFDRWEPIAEAPFNAREWSDGTRLLLPQQQQRIGFRFDPTGAAEPQELTLSRGVTRVRIAIDPAGKVQIDGRAL